MIFASSIALGHQVQPQSSHRTMNPILESSRSDTVFVEQHEGHAEPIAGAQLPPRVSATIGFGTLIFSVPATLALGRLLLICGVRWQELPTFLKPSLYFQFRPRFVEVVARPQIAAINRTCQFANRMQFGDEVAPVAIVRARLKRDSAFSAFRFLVAAVRLPPNQALHRNSPLPWVCARLLVQAFITVIHGSGSFLPGCR
jgi:hypothetical protein